MLKYLTIFLSPLLLYFSFLSLFYSQKVIHHWLIIVVVIVILLAGRILARNKFWQFKILWLNLILVYISQLLFLLLLISQEIRYTLSFVLALAWLLIWWLMAKYFENINNIDSANYLAGNKFFYYLGFWFLSTSLYSLVIFLHFPIFYAYAILIFATFFWALDIINSRGESNWIYLIFSLFLLSQMLAVVYLLPVSFYVAGTIATLWFFFIIDSTVNSLKTFKGYLSLFLLLILLLLITSII
jgi:hypothetical protein